MIPVQAEQQIRPDISLAKDIKCVNCGNLYFNAGRRIKFLSKLVSPDGKDYIIPMETLLCQKCGTELDPNKAVDALINTPKEESILVK